MNFALALANNKLPGVKVDSIFGKQLRVRRSHKSRPRFAHAGSFEPDSEAIEKALNDPALQAQLAAGAKVKQPDLPSLVAGLGDWLARVSAPLAARLPQGECKCRPADYS